MDKTKHQTLEGIYNVKFFEQLDKDKPYVVAVSGGIDSMCLLRACLQKRLKIKILFVNHLTDFSVLGELFVADFATEHNLPFLTYSLPAYDKKCGLSLEEFWSVHRNKVFNSLPCPVLTGHNLDDALEWYTMSTFVSQSKFMDYESKNVLRPLICTKRNTIESFVKKFKIPYVEDPTNGNRNHGLRNKIRSDLIPTLIETFPGAYTLVKNGVRRKHDAKRAQDNSY